jgi:nitrite reductase/ring-hydroxylating ferredoxin subunit
MTQLTWHLAVAAKDVPAAGKCRSFSINGEKFFVVNHPSGFKAYRNYCPHLGVTLEWREHEFLDPSGTLIECATHNALFKIEDGECVTGPCFGRSLVSVQCETKDDGIYIAV